ncbi:hypothetical protein QTP88_011735 [Uroleucon formosanum]
MQNTNIQFKIFLLYSDEECINILINILINTNNTNILSSINWESEFKNLGIEAAASRLQTILITLIEQYVPVHIFRRSTFPKWATLKLKNLIIDKKIAHKKLKQFRTMHYRHRFSLLRAQVKLESRLAYESYLSKINTSLQKDPRQFWSFINNRRNTSGIPNVMHYGDIITSDVDIANLFALLFNSVYKSPLPPIHWNSENIGIKLFTFLPSRLTIDPDEVEENLSSLRTTKSRGHDGISAQLLYLLLYVFNLSLAEGVFPSIWKTSQVTPIYKSGDPGSVSNYRPFSGLPLIGKLFEKIVNKCIERRFKLVLSTNQHGFYGGRPTTTSALEFSAFIRDSFKNMSQVDVIFTDISKAFDSISHIVLINILDRLGVGEPLLSWFKSYITGRRQFVSLFNQKSAEYLVTSGVPKDGHLSPLLFNILINTLCESVDCKMLLFADDVKLFSCVQSESDAISLQESLNKLVHWCNTVGLELTIHKCKVMSFSRRHSIIQYYSIDNVILQRINQVEDLGFIFTPTLSFAPHIDWIVGKALRSLGFIRRHAGSVMSVRFSKKYLEEDTLRRAMSDEKKKVKYFSWKVQNEVIELLATNIRNHICDEIRNSQCFPIIMDSTQDIVKLDQVSVVIWYVVINYDDLDISIKESFLGFFKIDKHEAQDYEELISEILVMFKIDINKCRGQGYDGTSVMSGVYSGVQTRIKDKKKTDIALISESHLTSSSKFKIFGYDCLQANHPDDSAHAGAALLISTKIPHSPFHPKSNQHMQIVATSININSIPTSIASAYFPPGSPFPAEDLSLFLQTLNHTYIIGADFNAKHEAWGCRSKNPRGRALHNFITIKRSKVISPASPTYWPTHANRHPDYLDFFLSNLPNHIHINISNLNDPASDHTPIILKIQANVPFHPLVKKRTDWNKFRNIMSTSSSLNIKLKNSTDIDTAINTLTNNIQDSFRISSTISATQDNSSRNTTPEIRELISQKRRARNTWQRTHYPIDKQRYNFFSNKLKSTLKKHKNQLYTSHIQSLSPSNGSPWRKTKALLKHKSTIPPLRYQNNNLATTDQDKSDLLANHLANTFKPHNISPDDTYMLQVDQFISSPLPIALPASPTTPGEVLSIVKKLRNNKSTGHDLINNKIVKNLPPKTIILLPTSLTLYFGYLISLPLGNQH